MSEVPWNRYESGENRNNKNISVFDSKKYQNELQWFYNINKNDPQTIQTLKDFIDKQEKDKLNVKEKLENPVLQETREWLDKQAMINEAKTMLYEKLWIDNNQNNNSSFENFEKWIVDELILNNYDLAIQVWETNGKIILDWLSQLATLEWLKKIAEALWESFWSLLTWNAYEKWKSVAELWLIWSWVWAWVYVWKKTLKLWMKQISKLRVNKEMLVQSPDIKNIIWKTNNKVDKIIPKKQLDFEKALVWDIAKLADKDRIEAWSFYLKRNLTPDQQESIIKAHNVWKDREWAWIYNYNQAEITEKVRILKEAWFSKEERKALLEKWVCGKEVWVNEKLLINELQKRKEKAEYWKIFDNLPENIRKLDLELSNYSFQQLEWIKIRLWLSQKSTIDDIDLAYRLKLKDVLERYKDLSDLNLARFEWETLDNLKKSWNINPVQILENEILKLEVMKDKWELLVVSAMSNEVFKAGIKFNHFANLDRIWYNDFRSPLWTKEWNLQYRIDRNYNELRGVTDNVMWVEWLDPTYLSLVISKNDIHNLSQYWDKFMVFGVDELHWRATITMNDSMLAWRFNWNSLDTQLIHYSTETLIKTKAIYNIDERLGFPIFNRMRWESFRENQRMRLFYEEMKPFIEVQVYWKTSDRVKESLSVDDIMKKFNN